MSAAAASEIGLEEITTMEGLEALEPEWRDLWSRCPGSTPFQSAQWLIPWMRNVYRGGDILILTLRCSGRLAAIAPLFIHRHLDDFNVRQVSLLGAGISDYLDFLIEPAVAHEAAERFLRYLAEQRSRWDLCDFQELRASSALLCTATPENIQRADLPGSNCPVLALPASMEELRRSLPRKFRTDLHRAQNRIRNSGDFAFETARPENVSECLDALFRLHAMEWASRNSPGVLSDENICAFHREVAAGFAASGRLRLDVLRHRGEIMSVVYGFAAQPAVYEYLGAFDPALARFSPGAVLIAHAIEHAIRDGFHEFDFLRGEEEYKHLWGARNRPNGRILLWHSGSHPKVQELIPDGRTGQPPVVRG